MSENGLFVNSTMMDPTTLNQSVLLELLANCKQISIDPENHTIALTKFGPMPDVFKPHWLQIYHFFFDVIFVGCILLAGVIGNVLSCLVLIRDRSHGTTSLILISLAVCDTLFLIECLFFQFLKTLSFHIVWIGYMNFYAHTSKILYGSGMAVRMMRNWMVVLVSLERWVAVCRPLHAPTICTRKKAKIAISCIVLISLIYNIPHFLIVAAKPLYCVGSRDSINNTEFAEGEYNSIGELPRGILLYHSAVRQWVQEDYLFRLIYRLIAYTIIIVILPNVIIGTFNILLIRGIKYANARRAQIIARMDCVNRQCEHCSCSSLRPESTVARHPHQPGGGHSDNHAYFVRIEKSTRSRTGEVNRLCVGVIIIYLVCELPAVGYQVIYLLQHREAIQFTRPVTNALVCLNSGVNFFVYVFLGRRFRSQLCDLFRNVYNKCRPHRADDGQVVHPAFYHNAVDRLRPRRSKETERYALQENTNSQVKNGCSACLSKGNQKRHNTNLSPTYTTRTSFTEV